MTDFIALADALPPTIKAGWVIWMAWTAAQVMWYRRARVTMVVQPATPPPVARQRPEPRASRPDAPPTARLPVIDLSDIPEPPSTSDDSAPLQSGSILGLDLRRSSS